MMRYRGHVYHGLLVLIFVLVRNSAGGGSDHEVEGRLWLESDRSR